MLGSGGAGVKGATEACLAFARERATLYAGQLNRRD